MTKEKKVLLNVLTTISILGFLAVFLKSLNILEAISNNINGIVFITLGIGLLIIGQARSIPKFFKDKRVTPKEFGHIATSAVGLFIAVTGTVLIFGITTPVLNGLLMVSSLIGIISIIFQRMVKG